MNGLNQTAYTTLEPPFAELPAVAQAATKGVLWLWRDNTFLRASTDNPEQIRPTVTFRCTEVMLGAAQSNPELFDEAARTSLQEAARVVVDTGPHEALDASDLNYPPFTLALLTLAIARVAQSGLDAAEDAKARVSDTVRALTACLSLTQLDSVHPFVQEHIMRALLAAESYLDGTAKGEAEKLRTNIVASAERQARVLIAKHHMSLISPGESVALAFCAAVLSSAEGPREDRMALAALDAAAAGQDQGGSWPLGRVVQSEPSRLEISTYEVAWVVTVTLPKLLTRSSSAHHDAINRITSAVGHAATFAERSLLRVDDLQGWASDHPYQQPRIESWTSAIALQFLLAGEELRREMQNREILQTFRSKHPAEARWPSWLRWSKLAPNSDPEAVSPVYAYLAKRIVDPILAHPRQLPSGGGETASVLLFGPPGTSKTTIVQAVADALQWPIVFLSPGTFIEQGLEAIEASAQSVFDRLERLRRVVVIFDECDELFRDRSPSGSTEPTRNISAFVTASMLPKLQDLHDRGEVLFFICTNHVRMMDAAVKRPGRIDHRVAVGPLDEFARAKILETFQPQPPRPRHAEAAFEQLVRSTGRFGRSELKRASEKLWERAPWSTAKAAGDDAVIVAESMSSSLTVTPEAFAAYEEDRDTTSDPYLETLQ